MLVHITSREAQNVYKIDQCKKLENFLSKAILSHHNVSFTSSYFHKLKILSNNTFPKYLTISIVTI